MAMRKYPTKKYLGKKLNGLAVKMMQILKKIATAMLVDSDGLGMLFIVFL